MKIIHISDIHLTIPGEPMGGLNPHARFAKALADVAENHGDATRIIITGDLTHWGEIEAYEALKQAISDVDVPVRLLLGNHDNRGNFLEVFPDHPVDANGYVNHAETIDGVHYIYLDTVGDQTHAGHFGADRIEWLASQLAGCTRARLFLHHNPMPIGLPAEDQIALVDQDQPAFHALLSEYADRIEYFHFGHVHAPIHGIFLGVPFASVPSTGNQSYPDLSEQTWLKGGAMEPAYFVLTIQGDNTLIHQIPFAWEGELGQYGTQWEDWAKEDVAP